MKIAAVTMVYQGYATLRRWCEHYGALVGHENLYIVSHGNDPRHREIGMRSNVIGIPRTGLDRFDHHRHNALNGLAHFLNTYLDVVLRVDVDEFVFADPQMHRDLASCFQSCPGDAWFALGFDVFARAGDAPLDLGVPYSEQRRLCVVSSMYSKAVASRNGVQIGFHGAKDPQSQDARRMVMPQGLYLAHVRHAEVGEPDQADSFTELSRVRNHAQAPSAYQDRAASFEVVAADAELATCYAQLSAGFERNRKKRPGIWAVPKIKRERAFELPERFVGLF